MRAFVFLAKSTDFFITKYLKQEVDDDFAWMNIAPVASLWYKDLLMLCGQKVMTLLSSPEKCPMDFYQLVVFTAQIL